jgi:EmrB/QacA subfamily drug resistance transporter
MPGEPDQADSGIPARDRRIIQAIVLVATAMAVIDGIVVSIALPTITRFYAVEVAQSQWVITAYLVTETCLLLIFGRLSEYTGKSRLFLAGLTLFTTGSLACGLATSLTELIAFRVIQACGSAMVFSISTAVMFEISPRGEQARAMGYIGATVAVAGVAAPILGGFITDSLGWEYIFLINVPIGLIFLILAARYLRLRGDRGSPLAMDWAGAGTMVISLASLILFLGELAEGSGTAFYGLVFLGSTAAFLLVESRSTNPLLDLRVLGNLRFTLPNAALMCIFIAFFMVNLVGPFYFEGVMQMKPSQVGLVFLIIPVIMVVASPLTGWLYDRWSWEYFPVAGISLTGISLLLLSYGALTRDLSLIVTLFVPLSLGSALFQSPSNTEIMRALPADRAGIASSLSATTRNLGMTLGVCLASISLSLQLHAAGYSGPLQEAGIDLLAGSISSIMVTGSAFCFAGAILYLLSIMLRKAGRLGYG